MHVEKCLLWNIPMTPKALYPKLCQPTTVCTVRQQNPRSSQAMTSRTGNPYLDFMLQNAVLFPWGSDDEEEEEAAFHRSRSPRKEFSGSRDRLVLEVDNASRITWKLPNHVALAGRILEHCQAVIHRVRLETGGLELAIYKMGITHDCCARFELYRAKGWDQMVVMHECPDLGSVEMLEAALISHHRGTKQCRNISKGGEGMRDKLYQPKFDPPYCCYVVSARADRARWVL